MGELIDKEEVKDVLGDTINSEGDYRHALRLLNGLNSVAEQGIVKPILDKIRAEIEDIAFDWQEIDGEHESFMVVDLNDVLNIIDNCMTESEEV